MVAEYEWRGACRKSPIYGKGVNRHIMIKNRAKTPFVLALLSAGILAGNAGLTGCGSREAEFLEKEAEVQAEDGREHQAEREKPDETDEEQNAASDIEGEPEPVEVTEIPGRIFVDVQGAVANPGVYELEEGSRVFQAVEAAGGCLADAAESYVNQAKGLSDGQQIYVPALAEVQEAESGKAVIAAKAPESVWEEENAEKGTSEQPEKDAERRIDLNTADVEQLTGLTGIGEAKAKAILAYRDSVGGFSSIEEIMNVEGIKEGTFSRIKDEIVVG